MAGYSGTPLVRKLGIKPGYRLAFSHEPATFRETLGPLPAGVSFVDDALDLAVAFGTARADLEARFTLLAQQLAPAGMLWISWPKKASGVSTDLTEHVVREIGLNIGLVDTKVCAIDETWSGLKFVIRVKDRPRTLRDLP